MKPEKYSAPFWSWNGKLTVPELKRQMRIFKEMGFGGVFMHSRTGLAVPYLSPRWFDLIRACIEEGKKLGIKTWIYDEDRWPSGYAGGKVTRNPAYRMKLLYFHESGSGQPEPEGELLREFTVNGKKLSVYYGDAPHTPWYNNWCYLNGMDPAASAEFLRVTHERYLRECEPGSFPGVFTDEPQYGFVSTVLEWAGIPWVTTPYDPQIRTLIRKRYHYDLLDRLAEFIAPADGDGFSEVNYHYVRTMTELFLKSYAAPIGRWHKRHGLIYTGHMMGEDSLATQTWNCGDAMAYYPYFGMPGIDQLGANVFDPLPARQLCSAARQFGQKDRLAELFGATGWDFPPEGHQIVGDLLQLHGVNFRCQHLSAYTLAGEAKRDYPASISFHLPWHRDYARLEERFDRIGARLHGLDRFAEILVISPVESVWGMSCRDFTRSERVREFDFHYAELLKKLDAGQFAFDCGSEILLGRYGSVKNGRLVLRKAAYRAVVLPKMLTIRKSTLELLEEFVRQGGTVVAPEGLPVRCEGERSGHPARLRTAAFSELESFRRYTLSDPTGAVSAALFRGKRKEFLMVVNAGAATVNRPGRLWRLPPLSERNAAFPGLKVFWRTDSEIPPCEYLPETDRYRTVRAVRKKDGWEIAVPLSRLQTRIFTIDPSVRPEAEAEAGTPCTIGLPGRLEYRLAADNVLLLDHFHCETTGPDEDYVLEIDRKLREQMGLPARTGSDVQPWAAPKKPAEPRKRIVLKTSFRLNGPPAGPFRLALENPEEYSITLNGKKINGKPRGRFVDPAIRTLALPPGSLRTGRNELSIETVFRPDHPGLEAMYLLGKFAVDREGKELSPLPEYLTAGDLTRQGLPSYSDTVCFPLTVHRPDERPLHLVLPRFNGALVRVKSGGKTVSVRWMQPCTIDLSGLVKPGATKRITLELAGTRRDLFGPFYTGNPEQNSAPLYFHVYKTRERLLVPFGWENADGSGC
ncbi:MAG: hypothetical protein IJS14_06695 [Lentisphaeria bacterium]|nr:hypothetical protein [Lentisphaeria bacterium]